MLPGVKDEFLSHDGSICLMHADCRDVIQHLRDVDAAIFDPPYAVGFTGKRRRAARHGKITNDSYDDNPADIVPLVRSVVGWSVANCTATALFAGNKLATMLPEPTSVGGVFSPSSPSVDPWGFVTHHQVAFYGRDPFRIGRIGGSQPNSVQIRQRPQKQWGHPCEKPIAWMLWLVKRAAKEGWLVCDPFMGSGTTGVACIRLGRCFVGIEKEERFYRIAVERIQFELSSKPLIKQMEQRSLL